MNPPAPWSAAHPVLAGEVHLFVAAGTLVLGTGAAVAAHASSAASVLVLVVTVLVGSFGIPVWAAGLLAAVTWVVHVGFFVEARGFGVGPEEVENLLLFVATAGAGWWLGRRATVGTVAVQPAPRAGRHRQDPGPGHRGTGSPR
ncbi:hypothetical protein CLV37_10756 [Kineococcus rhizosphaerae]|uniref:Uncharacterized protein n=1 Tax=Kineococcus rhizosphaerae TaxID=559628 RepID=A0A2T0R2A3_9ACTN|nr:hypothetical protein CLV37_10756 [Kineococcus rhizosphaerae]